VNGRIHFHTSDPDPSDDVPVKLNNKGFFKSFELITKLFSTPKYDEYDPTVLLAIGFMIFFALMLTDAMYGFVNLLLGLFLWKGAGNIIKCIKILVLSSRLVVSYPWR
jgi:Archaeal/vacuolar-type H+-ATPase subunit I